MLKLYLVIRVMPRSFGGDTYKRTKLWVGFRPNCELAGAALGRWGERMAHCLGAVILEAPFGDHIVGSPGPM